MFTNNFDYLGTFCNLNKAFGILDASKLHTAKHYGNLLGKFFLLKKWKFFRSAVQISLMDEREPNHQSKIKVTMNYIKQRREMLCFGSKYATQ